MTHSLHRHGNTDSLKKDFVVLALSQPALDAARKKRIQKARSSIYAILKSVYHRLRINKLFSMLGIRQNAQPISWTAVFDSRKELDDYLAKLKDADTGRSVVVSGLFDEVNQSIEQIGLRPHTVQFSLGCFGATDLLPKPEVLEITTLCGHHMVAPGLVETLAADVARGTLSSDDAAESMNKMCLCKIFNKLRAEGVLKNLAEQHRLADPENRDTDQVVDPGNSRIGTDGDSDAD